ncbi:MAG: PhzF family phenazine biosynthesis protein [Pyrinomonadaceae bacterium]
MKLTIYQVDAFTSELFGGNPAAVVPLEDWLDDETMQRIAAENNLSETAFFVDSDGKYDIRWFTPTMEVNLCGHATVASAHVIFTELNLQGDRIDFHSDKSGALGVERCGGRLILDFPAYKITEIASDDALAHALGKAPVKVWSAINNGVMVRLETERDVRELEPDFSALAQLGYERIYVTAPGDSSDLASRMFAPKIGINEDPVTGAMHCTLIPYWAGELGKNELFARQVSKRGGELFCEFVGDRVKIGGNAVTYLKGEIYVATDMPQAASFKGA